MLNMSNPYIRSHDSADGDFRIVKGWDPVLWRPSDTQDWRVWIIPSRQIT